MIKTTPSVLAIAISCCFTSAFAQESTANDAPDMYERIQIIGTDDSLRTEAGSTTVITEVELERFKFDDINRVLYGVPGVNIREEDGFGLRPNIGFRGATPERSKKITVMEDGVLIGPAPYSAPAAYYFPMMSKMTGVEVFKGPAAIKYGPNTVAGALNLVTRQIPSTTEGLIDVAAGSDGYGKLKGYYGGVSGDLGYLIEGIHLRSDGFKELDGGGDTGFEKNDVMVKLNYDLSSNTLSQMLELKVAYADELSNETYLGITDNDFAISPNRRYAASQRDRMDWEHSQFLLTHFAGNATFDVTTRLYRNNFERSWFKINGFKGGLVNRDLQQILAAPEDDTNAQFYAILTGQSDSVQEYEKIILGDNARKYYSQGIQSDAYYNGSFGNLKHQLNAGFRFHQDQIRRRHTEDTFLMEASNLITDGSATVVTSTNRESTDALSVFLKETLFWSSIEFTLGVRGEFFDSEYQNEASGEENDFLLKSTRIWLPGVSVFYQYSDSLGFFAGIHEGFIPTSPQESPEVDVENSIDYEIGTRYHEGSSQLEAVVFYNDFKKLKESCSFSAASACGDALDEEFNSGAASVFGVEFAAKHTFETDGAVNVPVSLTYTYTSAEFDTSFDSDFPMWGSVVEGDPLPYLPDHQVSFDIGLTGDRWDVFASSRYTGAMHEASGDGVLLSGVETKSLLVTDLSVSYLINTHSQVYLKVDNVFDEQQIVSRRPYGARGNKPRQFMIGYQFRY